VETNRNEQPSILGRSVQLSRGDLSFVGGDLAIIKDRENLLQAMKVMIETPFGTDIFNVNYGFDLLGNMCKPHSVSMIKELIRLNIVKSLSIDGRVREVKEVVFDDDPRYFELDPGEDAEKSRLTPQDKAQERRKVHRDNRCWQALVILELFPEGEVSLKLEGAGI
jgi:hypothetical protein